MEEMIRALAESGFEADAGAVGGITELGDAAFAGLARLATDGPDSPALARDGLAIRHIVKKMASVKLRFTPAATQDRHDVFKEFAEDKKTHFVEARRARMWDELKHGVVKA